MTTNNDPANYVAAPGQVYEGIPLDGVVRLDAYTVGGSLASICTGSLLPDGQHILTAAHCFAGLNLGSVTVTFEVVDPVPPQVITPSAGNIHVHPDYIPANLRGNDIAIIRLNSPAPAAMPRYDIYRNTDEIGETIVRVGYGVTGTGHEGEISETEGRRRGQNKYDAPTEILNGHFGFGLSAFADDTQLAYDFDYDKVNDPDPLGDSPTTDPFGFYCGMFPGTGYDCTNLPDLGVGLAGYEQVQEVMGSNGDSGGPAFIDGKIAGVASWKRGLSTPPDIDADENNSTFGEVGSDSRVSTYAGWIDSVVDIVAPRVTSVVIGTSLQLHGDYAVPGGSGEQLRTVPVGGANQILISFSDPVGVTQADLSLLGAFSGTAYDVLAPGNSFHYNPITRTAT